MVPGRSVLGLFLFIIFKKHINKELKLENEWIRANKLSLNVSKTETIIFKSKNKNITKCLNFRMSGQK